MAKSRIQIGNNITVKGKKFKISASKVKGKKYQACPTSGKGSCINFGAKGYTARPGTKRGDNYCARSSGIKSSKRISANDFARQLWNCKGKKSQKR